MKNQFLPTVVWWKSQSQKRNSTAKQLAEGYGFEQLVPGCYVGIVSAIERKAISAALKKMFFGVRDKVYIAPICAACHKRFTALNQKGFESRQAFEFV